MAAQPSLRHDRVRSGTSAAGQSAAGPGAGDGRGVVAGNPQIEIIARDRGGAYGLAAAKALPDAVQVADRWHLMENASRAFLDAVRKSMRQIRKTLKATRVNPKLLTAAERLQYEGYLRREQTNAAIIALAKDGIMIKEIVRRTGHSRGLVRQVLRGQRNDVFRSRESSLRAILNGSTRNGPPASGTLLSYGGVCEHRDFVVLAGS